MRKLPALFLCLLLLCILPASVYAHPGRTNSDGGHWDYENGDYHYHHGYPEHDHYDMDGDGYADCPYDFDDQTGANSGSQSSGNSDSSDLRYPQPTHPPVKYESEPIIETVTEEIIVKETPTWMSWIIGILVCIVFFLLSALLNKNEEITSLQKELKFKFTNSQKWFKSLVRLRYTQELECVENAHQRRLQELPPTAMVTFRDPFPFSLFEDFNNSDCPFMLPSGVTIARDGNPVLGYSDELYPYGKYTVYVTPKGKCYHTSKLCKQIKTPATVCILSVMRTRTPCSHCSKRFPTTVPQWYLNFDRASRSLDISWDDSNT